MKIATMVRGYLAAPHPSDMVYPPNDVAVAVAEGLQSRGHQVTFFGPTGTSLKTGVETLDLRPLAHNFEEVTQLLKDPNRLSHHLPDLWDEYFARAMFKQASEGHYDVLHFHHPEVALPFTSLYPDVPVISTIHDQMDDNFRELLELYESPNQRYVSISNNQRVPAPDLPYIATVHNGIDPSAWPLSDIPDDYLLLVGRIVPEKGVKEAIQVANQTGHRLLIIGPTYADQREYFDQYVKPQLNEKILYLGYMERRNIIPYYQKAKALLCPAHWEEPFGLTMIEAMSCGAPVIANRRGSIPEVVMHGKTGFVVDSLAEMAEAIGNLHNIKRADCHEHVVRHFSTRQMIDGYDRVFRRLMRPPVPKRFPKSTLA